MGTFTSWTTSEKLLESISPCDIIEFNRFTYSHFAFYIGNGVCINVQAPDNSLLGIVPTNRGVKRAERLVDLAGSDFVRVNNSELMAFQLGVYRRSESEAMSIAIEGLPTDRNGDVILNSSINVGYFLMSAVNCEGWSNYWRYIHPTGWSMQAANGLVHSTIGTFERFSEEVICDAELILKNDHVPLVLKAAAAAEVVLFTAAKLPAKCVRIVTDIVPIIPKFPLFG